MSGEHPVLPQGPRRQHQGSLPCTLEPPTINQGTVIIVAGLRAMRFQNGQRSIHQPINPWAALKQSWSLHIQSLWVALNGRGSQQPDHSVQDSSSIGLLSTLEISAAGALHSWGLWVALNVWGSQQPDLPTAGATGLHTFNQWRSQWLEPPGPEPMVGSQRPGLPTAGPLSATIGQLSTAGGRPPR